MSMIARDERSVWEVSKRAERRALIEAVQSVEEQREDDRATPEESIPPTRSQLGKANIKYLSSLIQQLVQLRNEAEQDDYGILRATKHAFDISCAVLIDASIVSAGDGRQIPYGCVATDSEGGVRIEWVRQASNVRLVVPASAEEERYVYHEEGTNYGTESATPEALARWLRIIKDE